MNRASKENLERAPRILVVEDQEPIQELVTAMLRTRGFACEAASSLAGARKRMETERYDVLFIDVNLPDGSGLSLVGHDGSDLPVVVVMTGRGDLETAVDAIRHGGPVKAMRDIIVTADSAKHNMARRRLKSDSSGELPTSLQNTRANTSTSPKRPPPTR